MKNLLNPKNSQNHNHFSTDTSPSSGLPSSLVSSSTSHLNSYSINGFSSSTYQPPHFDYPLIDLGADDGFSSGGALQKSDRPSFTTPAVRSDSWSEILSQIPITLHTSESNGNSSSSAFPKSNQRDLMTEDILDPLKSDRDLVTSDIFDDNNRSYSGRNGVKPFLKGYIVALKDSFGFIENEDHQNELFFHFRLVLYDSTRSRCINSLLFITVFSMET